MKNWICDLQIRVISKLDKGFMIHAPFIQGQDRTGIPPLQRVCLMIGSVWVPISVQVGNVK